MGFVNDNQFSMRLHQICIISDLFKTGQNDMRFTNSLIPHDFCIFSCWVKRGNTYQGSPFFELAKPIEDKTPGNDNQNTTNRTVF